MTRTVAPLVALAATALVSLATARADEGGLYDCTRDPPAASTHSFVLPTGVLTPRGDVELQVHELGLYNTLSIGLTDRLEISIGAPVVPVIGRIGARFSLTGPRSALKLVVGGGVSTTLMEGDGALLDASGTVAFESGRLNVHGTVAAFIPIDGEDGMGVLSAGVAFRAAPHLVLIADVTRMSMKNQTVYDSTGCMESCGGSELLARSAATVGVKLVGQHFDADLGFLVPLWDTGEDSVHAVPIASFGYRF